MTFKCIYARRRLHISIQDALSLSLYDPSGKTVALNVMFAEILFTSASHPSPPPARLVYTLVFLTVFFFQILMRKPV